MLLGFGYSAFFWGAKTKTQERPKSLLEQFGAFWTIVLGTKSTKQLWRVLLEQQFYHAKTLVFEIMSAFCFFSTTLDEKNRIYSKCRPFFLENDPLRDI